MTNESVDFRHIITETIEDVEINFYDPAEGFDRRKSASHNGNPGAGRRKADQLKAVPPEAEAKRRALLTDEQQIRQSMAESDRFKMSSYFNEIADLLALPNHKGQTIIQALSREKIERLVGIISGKELQYCDNVCHVVLEAAREGKMPGFTLSDEAYQTYQSDQSFQEIVVKLFRNLCITQSVIFYTNWLSHLARDTE